jgi:prepilin peptidase CpaA
LNLVAGAPTWLIVILALVLVAAAAQDAAKLKISNLLIVLVILGAVAAVVIAGPQSGLWQNGVVFAVFIALGLPLFATGKLGGGDVKLLAALGLWVDFANALGLLVFVLVAGGVLAAIMIAVRMGSWSEAARARVIILQPRKGIPYAIAIAMGGLAWILTQRV